MNTPLQILNKLKRIDVLKSAQISIENTKVVAEYEQREQLWKGVTKDETPILPLYRAFTIKEKIKKGQPYDRVTLKDTGDFYSGIKVDVRGELIVTESSDWKNQTLQQRYGKNILGLGETARIEYIRTLRPEFLLQIKSYLK